MCLLFLLLLVCVSGLGPDGTEWNGTTLFCAVLCCGGPSVLLYSNQARGGGEERELSTEWEEELASQSVVRSIG